MDHKKLSRELQAIRGVDTHRRNEQLIKIAYCNKVLKRIFSALGIQFDHIERQQYMLTVNDSQLYVDGNIVVECPNNAYEYDTKSKKWLVTSYTIDDEETVLSNIYEDFYARGHDVYTNHLVVYNDDYTKLVIKDEVTSEHVSMSIPVHCASVLRLLHTLPFDRIKKLYSDVMIYPIVEAHKTTVAFLLIRWYRQSIFTIIPKDVIRIIAKKIWEYRYTWNR